MSETTLSQAEIEELLQDVEEQREQAQAPGAPSPSPALNRLLYSAMLAGSGALELALGCPVRMDPPAVGSAPGSGARTQVVLPLAASGAVTGRMYLVLPETTAHAMLDILCGGSGAQKTQLGETQVGTVGELLEEVAREFAAHLESVSRKSLTLAAEDALLLPGESSDGEPERIRPALQLVYPLVLGDSFRGYLEHWLDEGFLRSLTAVGTAPPAARRGGTGRQMEVVPPRFDSLRESGPPAEPRNIDLLLDVPLEITVELGRARRSIRDVLALGVGSVLELEKLAGEAVDLLVNGRLVAKGEVVVIDENFGVRITSIITPVERVKKLGE